MGRSTSDLLFLFNTKEPSMSTPSVIPGANGSSFPGREDAIREGSLSARGTYNFGTPTSPLSPEIPVRLSPPNTDNSVFEVQVLERLSKLQRQQQTDAETLLTVVDARTSQLVNRLIILERTVTSLLPEGPETPVELTPLVEDLPPEVETKPAVHPELQNFNLETFVRIHLLKKLHFNNRRDPRGLKELKFDDLKWSVRDEFKKLTSEEQLDLVEDYVQIFLKKYKFESASFRKKYPTVDFKSLGQFFSNASRGLRNLVSPGTV
jgi:hypothetical protein